MLITVVLTLSGLGVGILLDEPLIYALLGFLLGRLISLELAQGVMERELGRLRAALAADWARRNASGEEPEPSRTAVHAQLAPGGWAEAGVDAQPPSPEAASGTGSNTESENQTDAPVPRPVVSEQPSRGAPETASPSPRQPAPLPVAADTVDRLIAAGRDWLQSGNLFVRIGILLLFFGVAFLIKYAVDQELLVFTMQMRLTAVGAGALGLLGLGWALRAGRREYALLLQGAAVGILYLDVYGAYQLYHLIGGGYAFALLFLVSTLAAALAVFQNASALAWFGFAGGFLAPVLASSGSDDHVALFGYYALLNAAILAVAWFRSWRALNLLGFGCTFALAGAWGVLRYDPSLFASTEPFLVLFFVFFVAISVLYAVHQPPLLKGYVDATLVFGTPILAFAYQVELVRHFDYGIAWSAAVLGLFYVMLSRLLLRFSAEGLGVLSQAFLGLGVLFLSVAVPFALAMDETAGVWALEGAGLVWVGVVQRRPSARAFGLLLQAGAAGFLVAGFPYGAETPFANGLYLGAAMVAMAGAWSGYWLDRESGDQQGWERGGGAVLLAWGLAWWFGAGSYELLEHFPREQFPAGILLYAVLTVAIAEVLASRWPWSHLDRAEAAVPLVGLVALVTSLDVLEHPAEQSGIWAWPLFFVACWLVLFRVERRDLHPSQAWSHVLAAALLAVILEWELVWRLVEQIGVREGWRVAAFAVVPLAMLQLVIRLQAWPVGRWPFAYGVVLGGTLAAALSLWALWSVDAAGGSAPLPWLPLLNPLDLTLALVVWTLFLWWTTLKGPLRVELGPDQERLVWMGLGALAFLWLNLVLFRAMHHWWGVDYDFAAMLRAEPVQMAQSVLWGVTGVALLLVAKGRASRGLWIGGAAVLAAVVVKLFVLDLAASGTVERIVSFLAVGGLLVGIGWFSPLPPRSQES